MIEKEILKKCKLTETELKDFYKKIKEVDKKTDHSRAYRTLMNVTRREILEFIEFGIKTFEEIAKKFNMDSDQLSYHLSMLEQLNFIMNCSEGWKSTPRGVGFLLNARME